MAGMEEMVRIGFPFPFPFASRLDFGIPDHRPGSSGTAVNGTLNGRRDRAADAGQRKS